MSLRKLFLTVATLLWVHTALAHDEFKILVFSKTAEFRHTSIPDGIAAIQLLAASNHFAADFTEDAGAFTDTNLTNYQAVVFLLTTGDVLDTNQQGAFERFIQAGGGYAGVHSAADTERTWPWYGQLVGVWQSNHPPGTASATVKVTDRVHPSTKDLPERWVRTDEWYNFQSNPAGNVHVLAWVDETSAAGYFTPASNSMGFDHPIAWCHEFDGGRSWYTALGHTDASYTEPAFLQHLLGGIRWAAGNAPADAGATIWSNYQRTILDNNSLQEPIALDVAPDGRVFYVERVGRLNIFLPATSTRVQIPISVNSATSDGLIGIALDPGFSTNQWIYLVYGPVATEVIRLSRFTMNSNSLDSGSEQILLTIPIESDIANHIAGDVEFGPDGCLYLSLGDNSRFSGSPNSGYAPIDERPGEFRGDAQRTSANTMDLRGKILRITPETNGTYSIPAGNLYPPGTPQTLPEIYVMGCRNPYRITVDEATGWVYWGEVGPDANSDSSTRGPRGYDEWNQARGPGFYGWPYGIANNKAYIDFDFATSVTNGPFDLTNVVNTSPNNTGLTNLSAAQPAWIWFPYGTSAEFPELGTSPDRCAMVGDVYHYNTNLVVATKLPAYFNNTFLVLDFTRNWLREIKTDTNGNVLKINQFLPNFSYNSPIEMKTGPDGALYLIEYGTGWRAANTGGRLVKFTYTAGNHAPTAQAAGTPTDGVVPLLVQFSSAGTSDDENDPLTYAWDFDLSGTTDSTNANPVFAYATPGNYVARLTVTDTFGGSSISDVFISAGNSRPTVTIETPPAGSFYDWGNFVRFAVSASDPEDGGTTNGTIACASILVETALGHDEHAHAEDQFFNCEGAFQVANDHTGTENIFYLVSGEYTDAGAPGVAPLSGAVTVRLNPKRWEPEFYVAGSGVSTVDTADSDGVRDVTGIDHGDYIVFAPVNLTNITNVVFRAAASGTGGSIELRFDGTNGPLVATAVIPASGGAYTTVNVPVTDPGGTHDLYLVFKRNPGDTDLFQLNWVEFQGPGVGLLLEPFSGTPAAVPGMIQAEDFDLGGKYIAYYDLTGGNSGGQYRLDTDVDIESCADAGGGFNLTSVRSNEWLHYTATIATPGFYTLEARVASSGEGGTFRVEVDGEDKTGPITVPNTGGAQNWQTVTITNIGLFSGIRLVRLAMLSDGPGGTAGNFNYLSLILNSSNYPPAITITSPAPGSSFATPAIIPLSATASDPDGTVAKVEFYVNAVKVGEVTAPPYSLLWSNVTVGVFSLTARAIDNMGFASTSAEISVTLTNLSWSNQDIGTVGAAGSFSLGSNGVFTIDGSGVDIWNPQDEFQFVHRSITGNAEIVARVLTLENTQEFAKAGVMFRESLAADSRNCFMAMTPTSVRGATFQWRTNTGDISWSARTSGVAPPYWVKLRRVGNIFTGYRSPDGLNWTAHPSTSNNIPPTAYVGLGVTSHSDGVVCTATFDNVAIHTPPIIVTPPASQAVGPGASAQLDVAASGGPPLVYQWRLNGNAIAGGTNFSLYFNSVQSSNTGSYTVVVTNYLGSVTSSVAQLTINLPPTVALTNPPNGGVFARPVNLPLMASATDSDGVSQVDFFSNGNWLGRVTNAPHTLIWSNPPAGTHLLSAAAIDNLGASNLSATISISLTNPPLSIGPSSGGFWSNGVFCFDLGGVPGDSVRVEASTNLINWAAVSTNVLNGGVFHFIDPGATNYPRRFYRGRYE